MTDAPTLCTCCLYMYADPEVLLDRVTEEMQSDLIRMRQVRAAKLNSRSPRACHQSVLVALVVHGLVLCLAQFKQRSPLHSLFVWRTISTQWPGCAYQPFQCHVLTGDCKY